MILTVLCRVVEKKPEKVEKVEKEEKEKVVALESI
jgi:hypothetical protein